MDDGDASRARPRSVLHEAGQFGQDAVADEDVVGALAGDADPSCAGAALGGCSGPGTDAPRWAARPVRGGGGVRLSLSHGRQDTDRLSGLDPQCHENESGDLLGAEPVGGHSERGDLGVQR